MYIYGPEDTAYDAMNETKSNSKRLHELEDMLKQIGRILNEGDNTSLIKKIVNENSNGRLFITIGQYGEIILKDKKTGEKAILYCSKSVESQIL